MLFKGRHCTRISELSFFLIMNMTLLSRVLDPYITLSKCQRILMYFVYIFLLLCHMWKWNITPFCAVYLSLFWIVCLCCVLSRVFLLYYSVWELCTDWEREERAERRDDVIIIAKQTGIRTHSFVLRTSPKSYTVHRHYATYSTHVTRQPFKNDKNI